jgi:hypothetical protein
MKNKIKFQAIRRIAGIIALLAVVGFSMAACGGDDDAGWDGQDISNWPSDGGNRLYFRVTKDKQTMAMNPAGRGDGQGHLTPDIFVVQQQGKGTFPVGTWINQYNEQVVFTATTFTRYWNGKPVNFSYTISGDYFLLTQIN